MEFSGWRDFFHPAVEGRPSARLCPTILPLETIMHEAPCVCQSLRRDETGADRRR